MTRTRNAGVALCLLAAMQATARDTDPTSGLIIDDGWETVRHICTECHSAQLITANAGNRAVWKSRIRWMQSSQGLQSLTADTEAVILTYLATHYGPRQASRRAHLPPTLMPTNPYRLESEVADPASR